MVERLAAFHATAAVAPPDGAFGTPEAVVAPALANLEVLRQRRPDSQTLARLSDWTEREARRLEGTGVSAFSVHPGWVRSNLVQHMMPPWVQNWVMRPFSGLMGLMGPEEGAQTQLHCLLDDHAPKHSGAYFSQNAIFYADKDDRKGGWPMRSPNPLVYDDALADRLFAVSNELVGLARR